jgi:hypothetical protein
VYQGVNGGSKRNQLIRTRIVNDAQISRLLSVPPAGRTHPTAEPASRNRRRGAPGIGAAARAQSPRQPIYESRKRNYFYSLFERVNGGSKRDPLTRSA